MNWRSRPPSTRAGPEATDHAAAGQRPLLPRPGAGGLSRAVALFRGQRRHPAHLRGLVAGNDPPHGGGGHRRHRAAGDRCAGATSSNNLLRYLPFEGQVPERRVVLAWRRSFRDSRRSRRWRRPSMNAGCRACRCWRARSRQNRISPPRALPRSSGACPRTGGPAPWHPACSFWLRRLVFGCSTQFIDCSSYRLSRINVEPPCGPKSVVAAVLSLLSPFNRSHRWPSPPRRPPVFRAST